ncbi:uncharacterized protein TNCV_2194211 [Trichonephila clavipes]|uniref:Uncharacterized protein n=1 Tax=Trichonephila clavipes TaxID=2585209 RepID=A0A8X6SFT1_TRICX|nr:uncharacterized protein TNCV_2194211 [Trichonephila clavipes]
MASLFTRSYTVGFFPMGPSQGTGVSRRKYNTNGLSCSSCTSVDPTVLRHVMTAIPQRAQACLDMDSGHFEYIPQIVHMLLLICSIKSFFLHRQ